MLFEGVASPGVFEHFPVVGTACTPGRTLTVSAGSRCVCVVLLLPLTLFYLAESVVFTRT